MGVFENTSLKEDLGHLAYSFFLFAKLLKGRPKLLLIAKIAGENNITEIARFLSSASET